MFDRSEMQDVAGNWRVVGIHNSFIAARENDDALLALTRGGVLTRVVRWAEEDCALPRAEVGPPFPPPFSTTTTTQRGATLPAG